MEELVERIARWGIHPDKLITHKFKLAEFDKAYELINEGNCGKVAIVFEQHFY
jgi:threonine dehydrogenase-like Zn-dependent dehydrogenase